MNQPDIASFELDDTDFMSKFIFPAHYPIAVNGRVRFSIHDCTERVIICSHDLAKERGFKDVKAAIFKLPGIDYQRSSDFIGSREFNIHISYLQEHKKSTQYIHINKRTDEVFLTTSEPIMNFAGEVIGRKDSDVPFRIFSQRDIIECHFKGYGVDIISLDNITDIRLTEQEELILFMLVGRYSQQDIAHLMNLSRSMVYKIIAEKLCIKFGMEIVSTKLLVEKAVSCGFANIIPRSVFSYFALKK